MSQADLLHATDTLVGWLEVIAPKALAGLSRRECLDVAGAAFARTGVEAFAGSGEEEVLASELDLSALSEYKPTSPAWLVKDLLEAGDVVNLAAFWGVGKSWFAQNLAVAIADEARDEFLGRMVMKHGPVCYFDGESKESSAMNRLRLLGGESGLQGVLHYHLNTGLQLSTEEGRNVILGTVARHNPVLVVFDSFSRFRLGRDENSADEMARLFAEAIQPISREYGGAVLLLDHVPKESGRKADPNRAMRGSGEKGAQTDRLWVLKKHSTNEPGKVVLEFGRAKDGPDQAEGLVIQRYHGDRVWMEVLNPEEARLAQVDAQGLLEYLQKRGGGAPQKEVTRDVFKASDSAASKAIRKLEADGYVSTDFLPGSRKAKLVTLARPTAEGRMLVVS